MSVVTNDISQPSPVYHLYKINFFLVSNLTSNSGHAKVIFFESFVYKMSLTSTISDLFFFSFVPSSIRKYADGRRWDIEGKCALVTDGTSGIGLAFARELLKKKAAVLKITFSLLIIIIIIIYITLINRFHNIISESDFY